MGKEVSMNMIIEITITIIVGLCMIPAAVMDCKTRKIDIRMFLYSLGPMLTLRIFELICYDSFSLKNELLGIGIGVFFVALSLISSEAIGLGDSLTILWLGLIMGGKVVIIVLCSCLFLDFIVAFVLVLMRKRKVRIPMLPFLTVGYLMYILDVYL
jgi:Flp pilus assembly protein protease CpaA